MEAVSNEKKIKLAGLMFQVSKNKGLTQSNEPITGRAELENGFKPDLLSEQSRSGQKILDQLYTEFWAFQSA